MKKILFLFVALVLGAMGAKADVISNSSQLENTAIYSIKSVDRGYMICVDDVDALCGTTRKGVTFDANNPNHQWALLNYNEKWYMYNVGQKKFVSFKSTDNADPTCLTPLPLSHGMAFKASTGGNASTHPLVIAIDGTHEFNMSSDQGPGVLTSWNDTKDNGNTLAIEKIGEFDPSEALGVLNGTKALQVQNLATSLFLNVKADNDEGTILGKDPEALYFTAVDGGFEIKDADDNYVGGHTNTWNMSSSTPETWTVEKVSGGFAFKSKTGGNSKYMGFDNPTAEGSAAYRDKSYSSNSGIFLIEDYGVTPTVRVNVTYKVTNFKGEEIDIVVENVVVGTEASNPITNGYFTGAITESDLVISETNNTFHVTGTWEFPFAEDKYYTMHSKANANNYVCNGTNAWYNNSVTVAENNNVWEFTHVAGTLDLFTVKNYGHNKYAVLSGSGRNACTFAAEPTVWTEGTGATSYFRVVKQDGGFNLQHPGDAETNVGSHVDNKFGSWKASGSPTNAASINVIEETTPVAPAEKANVTYNYVVDGKPINYTTSSEQVVGQAPAAPASYDFATVTSNAEELTVAGDGSTVVTVQVTQELPFGLGDGSDQFLHRGFLHVHSNQGRYMYFDYDDEAEAMMVYDTENYETGSGLNKKLTMDFPSSASTCKWHITGNVVEGFKLYNDTYEFVLAATAPQATMLSVDDPANGENPGTAFVLKRSTAGVGEFNFKRGFCLYAPERSQYLNAQTKMMYWTAADAGSTFEFEESYDVTIGEAGLATLYYHTPLSLDNVEGLTAYTLTLEGDYLVANETSTIPAYTGVVLAGEAKTYTLPVAFENVPGMGALTGSYTEKATPANCYVLSKDGNDACFAKYTGAKVGEFKAYFIGETANSESNYRISFGELTSIISAAQQNGGQAIYDLQGRRVVSAKGISIVNGKKVIK